jgi:hypothetical protein
MRLVGRVARIEEKRTAHRVLMGKQEGKRALGKPSLSWKSSIKVYLREVAGEGMDYINLAQGTDQWRAL